MTQRKNNSFWTGLITGTGISILTAIVTIWFQHTLTLKEKTIQLYLDEKKEFVSACDEYLKQYRQWRELMNYLVNKDTIKEPKISEFTDMEGAIVAYTQWRKDVDFAYGKIFILSDNEFGYKTLEVSTVLHGTLSDLFNNSYDLEKKQAILNQADNYFFENWLIKAQEEIFRFNTGNRRQKSITEIFDEHHQLKQKEFLNDSIDSQLYENLLKANNYQLRQDSLSGRKPKGRMPTKEEFDSFLNRDIERKNER